MRPVVSAQLDYYAVLEITPSADTVEINAAFRRLAWRYHPDRNPTPGATLRFQDINEAHQVLSDPARRAEYDGKWHPEKGEHRRAESARVRPHSHHGWRRRRHRHVKTVLTTLFSLLFVSTAWTVIFAGMNAAHSGSSFHLFESPSSVTAVASQECGFSTTVADVCFPGRKTAAVVVGVRNGKHLHGEARPGYLPCQTCSNCACPVLAGLRLIANKAIQR